MAEWVATRLRRRILEGDIQPGSRIRQGTIAAEYGMSRIPVREALRLLAGEGLVILTSHVGARVTHLDLSELGETYQLRERLEPFVIAESAPNLSRDQLDELRSFVDTMEEVADPANLRPWLELDRRFHIATYAGADLPRFKQIVESLWNTTQQYRRLYTSLSERLDLASAEHRLLVEALCRGDGEDAQRLLQTHIRRTRLTLMERGDLFTDQPTVD
jgi:DNA-binding GntR family transcriptional regulator